MAYYQWQMLKGNSFVSESWTNIVLKLLNFPHLKNLHPCCEIRKLISVILMKEATGLDFSCTKEKEIFEPGI